MVMGNYPLEMPVMKAARIVEEGAGSYNFDVFVPAGAIILDLGIHNEVLWDAATSAAAVVGDYASSDVDGVHTIGAAIDADGFIASTNLKATDALAGESISFSTPGGKQGAYVGFMDPTAASLALGSDIHIKERLSLVDRFVRFNVTSVGAGSAGRSYCWILLVQPSVSDIGL